MREAVKYAVITGDATRQLNVSREAVNTSQPLEFHGTLPMSLPNSPAPSPTSTPPPKSKHSSKASPSPLRPNSTPQLSGSQRHTPLPSASPLQAAGSLTSPSTPPLERSKTRARDLLRKHYGLNVTPPPPSGRPMDPMDLGGSPDR
jgi:hypothetical protein